MFDMIRCAQLHQKLYVHAGQLITPLEIRISRPLLRIRSITGEVGQSINMRSTVDFPSFSGAFTAFECIIKLQACIGKEKQ